MLEEDMVDLGFSVLLRYHGPRARSILHTLERNRRRKSAQFFDLAAGDLQALQITYPPTVRLDVGVRWSRGEVLCRWSVPRQNKQVSCVSRDFQGCNYMNWPFPPGRPGRTSGSHRECSATRKCIASTLYVRHHMMLLQLK